MDVRQLERTIDRYLAGNATPEETVFINNWLNRDTGESMVLDESSRQLIKAELWQQIADHSLVQQPDVAAGNRVIRLFASYRRVLQYAAILLLIITAAAVIFTKVTKPPADVYTTVVAASGQPKVFVLPDSTEVHLFPNSTLRFANNYNALDRKVQLTGRGFFNVHTNADRPFSVDAAGLITRVLGTSFEVSANDSTTVSIVVRSGKVAVDNRDHSLSHLSPDQRLVWRRRENTFKVDDVHAAILCEWWNNGLAFQQAPLQEVVASISNWYNIPIHISNKKWLAEKVTVRLDTSSVTAAMNLLSQTLGLTFKKDPNQIIIY